MPDKRYQVFVSSTYHDLEGERQEVMHALLELDCMPAGMELFPAANETQWNLIKKVIDDCDYYVLIIGGRYGSTGPDGLSYTEMEYRYALESRKPIIAFLHRSPGQIVADKTEQSPDGKRKLAEFRSFVEKRICKHWDSPAELGSVVSRSLIQLIKAEPAVGWVRANELPDEDSTTELLRLRRQVDELQVELKKTRTSAPKGTEDLAQGNDAYTFKCSVTVMQSKTRVDSHWTFDLDATWNDVFSTVAPQMIHEIKDSSLKAAINVFALEQVSLVISKDKRFSDHTIQRVVVDDQVFQTIKIQFRATGLMTKSEKPRSVKDPGTYWTLTSYGDEVMTRLRAIRREQQLPE